MFLTHANSQNLHIWIGLRMHYMCFPHRIQNLLMKYQNGNVRAKCYCYFLGVIILQYSLCVSFYSEINRLILVILFLLQACLRLLGDGGRGSCFAYACLQDGGEGGQNGEKVAYVICECSLIKINNSPRSIKLNFVPSFITSVFCWKQYSKLQE